MLVDSVLVSQGFCVSWVTENNKFMLSQGWRLKLGIKVLAGAWSP